MKPKTITISRQYGSGGRAIAEKLAKEFGIPCYDNEVISLAAKESGAQEWEFGAAENPNFSNFIFSFSELAPRSASREIPYSEIIFQSQSDAIRRLYEKGPAVFLGRCGNHVLRDKPDCVHLFICGSLPKRVQRAVEAYGVEAKNADATVRKMDKARAAYYYSRTGHVWGDTSYYDLAVNTDQIGVDGAVALVKAYLDIR